MEKDLQVTVRFKCSKEMAKSLIHAWFQESDVSIGVMGQIPKETVTLTYVKESHR